MKCCGRPSQEAKKKKKGLLFILSTSLSKEFSLGEEGNVLSAAAAGKTFLFCKFSMGINYPCSFFSPIAFFLLISLFNDAHLQLNKLSISW